jgi:hypothetical protein
LLEPRHGLVQIRHLQIEKRWTSTLGAPEDLERLAHGETPVCR